MAYKGRKSANKVLAFPQQRHVIESISAPTYLDAIEQKLFDSIAADYDIRSNTAALILEIAMQQHQRVRQARDVIKKEGMTVNGPNGIKAHPMLVAERQAQNQMLTSLRRLGVTLDD